MEGNLFVEQYTKSVSKKMFTKLPIFSNKILYVFIVNFTIYDIIK